jgi:hypothetical protein
MTEMNTLPVHNCGRLRKVLGLSCFPITARLQVAFSFWEVGGTTLVMIGVTVRILPNVNVCSLNVRTVSVGWSVTWSRRGDWEASSDSLAGHQRI